MNLLTMDLLRIFAITLLLSVCSIFCFPSKPLNERSKELAWQAWLLIDDQNQSKQYDPEMFMRRRITPKSVFIAPTFSPEKLPICAEGFIYNANGKCVKIFKIDEAAHLDFLLQKLDNKFSKDYTDTVDESAPTPGPYQVNIPLVNTEKSEEQYDDEITEDITNIDSIKTKRTEATTSQIDIQNRVNSEREDTTITESTTLESSTETAQTTETTLTTLMDKITIPPDVFASTIQDSTTTEAAIEITHALFFLDNLSNKTYTNDDVTLHEIPNGSIIIGSRIKNEDVDEFDSLESATTNVDVETTSLEDSKVELPTDQELNQSQITAQSTNTVHFPSTVRGYQELPHPNVQQTFYTDLVQNDDRELIQTQKANTQFEQLFQDYITSRSPDLKTNERHIFKTHKPFSDRNINFNNHQSNFRSHQRRVQQAGPPIINHRNRDKQFYNLPSDWSDIDPNKPIVLKFSDRSQINRESQENMQNHKFSSHTNYREVPPEDLSYIFGINRMPRNSR